MKLEEVVELIKKINVYYNGRFQLENPKRTVVEWHQVLKDEDPQNVFANLKRHVRVSHFIPTISDLLKEADGPRVVPGVEETQAYLKRYEERAAQPKDETEIKRIQAEIRENLLNAKKERQSDGV